MKIVIFGLGSIGLRHAEILKKNFSHELFAFRSGKAPSGNPLSIPEITSWKEVQAIKPQVALITNPTSEHIPTALACAERGMHLFIEKPLSDRTRGIDALILLCRRKRLTAYVAYCLRFHPVIQKMAKLLEGKKIRHGRVVCSSLLHQWRPTQDTKKSYSAHRARGGGVVLDLSHEFDYIHFLFKSIVKIDGVHGRAGHVTVDAEDFADAIVTTGCGALVNLHLNFSSFHNERTILVDFNGGFVQGDLLKSRIVFCEGGKQKTWDLPIERNQYLKAQLEYFFRNIRNPRLMNNVAEAKGLLTKILGFRNG